VAKLKVPFAKVWMDEREVEAVRRPLLAGWVTQGPEVAAFEREFAAAVGAPHACAVSSCTTALHLALLAVGVRPGDEVITVSHSFIATANVVRYCGAMPVFVDIEPGTYNIDPALIDRVVTPRTRTLLAVHQMGMPCDLKAILDVARRHGLPVIEDAACGLGSEIHWHGRWERIGKPHADIACFSFHPRKAITTGDGGMITTANAEWDARFRPWRHHGMGVPDSVRHGSDRVVFESYDVVGYNYRLTDIQAAVGREQLKRLDEIVACRHRLAARYREVLSGISGVTPPTEPPWAHSTFQSYCVRLAEHVDQQAVMQAMLDAGIATRRGVMCAHLEGAYPRGTWSCGVPVGGCDCPPGTCQRLRESERAFRQCILLPMFPQMTAAQQDLVAAALRDAVGALGRRESR
jgi:dTDP-4-amino-4,6-dideoxygalactose transaminase